VRDADGSIECDEHGVSQEAYACRHVSTGVACGFHSDVKTFANPCPDAWCDLCDEALAGGKWTKKLERAAQIRIMCRGCYAGARARNCDVPRLARGAAARLTDAEARKLLHETVHSAQAMNDAADARWGFIQMARWDFDGDARTLTFSSDDARSSRTCDPSEHSRSNMTSFSGSGRPTAAAASKAATSRACARSARCAASSSSRRRISPATKRRVGR
jgi:hypothetical protein